MNRRTLVGLVVFVAVVSAGAYGAFALFRAMGRIPLPQEVAGMSLVQSVRGLEAVEDITDMHQRGPDVETGAFGQYGGHPDVALIWVSESSRPESAVEMGDAMEEAIRSSETPFALTGVLDINGREVRQLTGGGFHHFFFRAGSKLVWVAANQAAAEQSLTDVMAFYAED